MTGRQTRDGNPATDDATTTDDATPEDTTNGGTGARAEPDPWDDPRLPWEGKPRRADVICLTSISLSGFYFMGLTPAIPTLLGTNPVLLAFMSGSTPSTVTAGAFASVGRTSVPLAIAAGAFGSMLFNVLFWWAGRLWGRRTAEFLAGRSHRSTKVITRMEWLIGRFGWVAVLLNHLVPGIPNGFICAAAGWTGMPLAVFLLLDLAGAVIRSSVNVGLGYTIGEPAVEVAELIADYALWSTIALMVVVFGYQFWRARRDTARVARDDPAG